MPRPIIMTDEMKQKAKDDFSAMLEKTKMSDGTLQYRKSFKYDDLEATVWLTPEAYRKIISLVTSFPDEVGWHGIVTRAGEDEFIVEDILVYPQWVTGSTVSTDQAEYTKWLYDQDDEVFNKIRMQGHSHVNMNVRPSGVDEKHRAGILEQLDKDMFYIFMVWNKSLSVHTLVYDMSRNILFEDDDVTVQLAGDDGMDNFLADARDKVQKKSYGNKKTVAGAKKRCDEPPMSGVEAAMYGYHQYPLAEMYESFGLGGEAWRY